MNSGHPRRRMAPTPELRGPGEIDIGIIRHDAGTPCHGHLAHGGRHNDTGRPGGGQLLLVTRVAQKTQFLRLRRLQRRQPDDLDAGISLERAAQRLNELRQAQAHAYPTRRQR